MTTFDLLNAYHKSMAILDNTLKAIQNADICEQDKLALAANARDVQVSVAQFYTVMILLLAAGIDGGGATEADPRDGA